MSVKSWRTVRVRTVQESPPQWFLGNSVGTEKPRNRAHRTVTLGGAQFGWHAPGMTERFRLRIPAGPTHGHLQKDRSFFGSLAKGQIGVWLCPIHRLNSATQAVSSVGKVGNDRMPELVCHELKCSSGGPRR